MSVQVVRQVHSLVDENNLQGLRQLVLEHGVGILGASHPESRFTPLITACFANAHLSIQTHREVIAYLVQQGVDVNNNNDNARRVSALHVLMFTGDNQLVKLLLDNGANVELRTAAGRTPIFTAAHYRRQELVTAFVAANHWTTSKKASTLALLKLW